MAGSLREPSPLNGLPFGAAVWAAGYVILPEAGIYKPIWEYDAKTLARDLGGHLAYGAGTGTAFWLFVKFWQPAGKLRWRDQPGCPLDNGGMPDGDHQSG